MPKSKFALSRKHEKLIDIAVNIPTNKKEMSRLGGNRATIPVDHRGNAENSLVLALETISRGTAYQEICYEIIEKCNSIFEYYDSKT